MVLGEVRRGVVAQGKVSCSWLSSCNATQTGVRGSGGGRKRAAHRLKLRGEAGREVLHHHELRMRAARTHCKVEIGIPRSGWRHAITDSLCLRRRQLRRQPACAVAQCVEDDGRIMPVRCMRCRARFCEHGSWAGVVGQAGVARPSRAHKLQ